MPSPPRRSKSSKGRSDEASGSRAPMKKKGVAIRGRRNPRPLSDVEEDGSMDNVVNPPPADALEIEGLVMHEATVVGRNEAIVDYSSGNPAKELFNKRSEDPTLFLRDDRIV